MGNSLDEPMEQFKWVSEFNSEPTISPFFVKLITKPVFVLNKFLWFKWYTIKPIKIEIIGAIGNAVPSNTLYDILASGRKIDFQIKSLDSTGVVIEEWLFKSCDCLKFDMGNLINRSTGCSVTFSPNTAKRIN